MAQCSLRSGMHVTLASSVMMCFSHACLLLPSIPDLILWQRGIKVAENGLQIDSNDTHGHVLQEFLGLCQYLYTP